MFKLYRQNDKSQVYVNSYVADTNDDIKDLPTKGAYPGSTCIVTETADVWMLSASYEWVKL